MGKEGRGRKAAGERAGGEGAGGGGRGGRGGRGGGASPPPSLGAPRAPSAAARPAPRLAAPRLGRPPWPRLLPPSGPALRFPLPPAPPPPSTQIPTPRPKPRSRRRRRRHTPLGLGLARLPRWPGPPCLAPTRSLALLLLLLCQSGGPARAAAPPRHPGSSRIGAAGIGGGVAPTRAGWPEARDVSAAPPPRLLPLGVARRPPSAVQQPQNRRLGPGRTALGSRATPLQPPPREPVSGPRGPGARALETGEKGGGGLSERASGRGRPGHGAGAAVARCVAPSPQ